MKKTDIRVHSEIPAYQNRTLLPNELPGQIGFEFQAFLFLKAYAEFDLCKQPLKDLQWAPAFFQCHILSFPQDFSGAFGAGVSQL